MSVGVSLGVGCSVWFLVNYSRTMDEVAAMYRLAWEGDVAVRQYLDISASQCSKIYALKHFIQFLELHKGDETELVPVTSDLAIAYARLGVSAEQMGQREQARKAYVQSAEYFRQMGREFGSLLELKQRIKALDQGVQRGLAGDEDGDT